MNKVYGEYMAEQLEWSTEKRKISDLVEFDHNPRILTPEQESKLRESLEKFGLVEIPAVDVDGTILAGHQRLKVYQKINGNGVIDVRVPNRSLTDIEREEYLIRSNKNTGEWDFDMLKDSFSEDSLLDWGFDSEDLIFDMDDTEENYDTEEDEFEEIVPEVPKTELGRIYQLGKHRLMCGDSTSEDSVKLLMDGKKAEMCFTDPPYLMDFTGGMTGNDKDGYKQGYNSKHDAIKNDKMSKADGEKFLDDINNMIKLMVTGAFYITFYRLGIGGYFSSLDRVSLQVRSLIIWEKGNHTLSNSDYMSRYEPMFYGWVDEHNFYGGNNGMDVWNIPRTKKNDLHPTMKPIELCSRAIENSSKSGEIVLDLFGGSGSTLIACEKTNREARLMELDPKYCDVIVKRYCELKGIDSDKVFELGVAE